MNAHVHDHGLTCAACRLPFAIVRDGKLVIQSKHGSDRHVNTLTVEEVERLLAVMRGGQRRLATAVA